MGKFKKTVENAKKNPSATKKTTIIEGFWKLEAKEGPQFETNIKTENAGEILVETDETLLMGGEGMAPNPVQVFISGFLACYSATFAKWAAMEGVILKHFKTTFPFFPISIIKWHDTDGYALYICYFCF